MPAVEDILEVRGLRKSFGSRTALDDVDLSLSTGSMLALLGPNGAGKTTLIRAVCGRLVPDAGTVRVAGDDPTRVAAVRRRLGFVPQEIALYPHLSVRENLEVLGRLAGVSRARLAAAVTPALERAGLTDRAGERVDRLSGGLRRRANLVAATLHRPDLLLLDEPTVGVDPNAREELHAMLRDLRESGTGILITTHDLEEAEQLADTTAFLVDGRIRAVGSPSELIREHFGTAKELVVTLERVPGDEARAVLEEAGLASTAEPRCWSGRVETGESGAFDLGPRLLRAGSKATEIRVREPGLREVFHRVTGMEFRA